VLHRPKTARAGKYCAVTDPARRSRPELSIVTTLYRSAPYLREFYDRCVAAAAKLFSSVEFIFVNDGSPDGSLEVALGLREIDPRIRIIDLSRNFGQHHAVVAGLEHSRGDLVFLIDCDLEENPEFLLELVEKMRAESADVTFGVQAIRKGGPIERIGGDIAYRLIDALSGGLHIPRNMMLARVMTRRYVDAFLRQRESQVVFSYLAAATGFKQVAVTATKKFKGETSYHVRARLSMMLYSTIAFSDRPLYYIAYAGFGITASAILYITYLLIVYALSRTVPAGFTSLAASVWLLGGAIIFSIGIVAIYLSIIYVEVKRRPRFIIRRIYGPEERETA
jgi:putative glycosyltransferase